MQITVKYDDYEQGMTSAKVIFDKEEETGVLFTLNLEEENDDDICELPEKPEGENGEDGETTETKRIKSKGLVCDTSAPEKTMNVQCIEGGILGEKGELKREDIVTLVKLLRNLNRELK